MEYIDIIKEFERMEDKKVIEILWKSLICTIFDNNEERCEEASAIGNSR
jgi:uncharacterized cysteine cluster protein YcgN (CxxCxxCC family)